MYNCCLIPSGKDERDYVYSEVKETKRVLPISYFNKVDVIFDQGKAGTCGWNAIIAAMMVDNAKYGNKDVLSRLYGYAKTKAMDGIKQEGIKIRDGLDVAIKQGTCLESMYPYNDSENTRKLKFPTITDAMNRNAQEYKCKAYARLYTINDVKEAVVNEGGAIIGLIVTEQFSVAENNGGFIGRAEGLILGGHAMFITGYDDNKKMTIKYSQTGKVETYTGGFKILNSWTDKWGDNGFGWIPYACFDLEKNEPYYFNLVNEAWTLLEIEKGEKLPEKVDDEMEVIKLKLGSKIASVDGKEVTLTVAPKVENGTTLAPIRFISEALGCKVDYNATTKEITITK